MSVTEEYGEIIVARDDLIYVGGLRVLQADPRVLIGAGILNDIRRGAHHPAAALNGDVLTINAENQRVVYRIGEYLPEQRAYVAEWPD